MDPATRLATLHAVSLTLTKVEFDLLFAPVESAGRVLSREQLLLAAADRDCEAFDRPSDVHVSALRKTLGDDSRTPRFIEPLRGIGDRLIKAGAGDAGASGR